MTAPMYSLCLLLLGLLSLVQSEIVSAGDHPPTVAFLCGKPAMHLDRHGNWQRDEKTDCLTSPPDILDYCKKVYPDMEVTNWVQSQDMVTIDNWCSFGHERCHKHGSHTVRPIRCLVGAFQSEALLVPDHCIFDHIHKTEECRAFEDWNHTSAQSCTQRGMKQQSFAILLPCGIDMFGGVEFVCCPPESDDVDELLDQIRDPNVISPEQQDREENESIEDSWLDESEDSDEEDEDSWEDDYSYSDEEDDYDYSDYESEEDESEEIPTTTTTTAMPAKVEIHVEQIKTNGDDSIDPYTDYLKQTLRTDDNEHNQFYKAKAELQKHHHDKVTKMMKEWASARQHVQDMKTNDPKAAEKLNREITARFQKTYEALEQEGAGEKKQLVALHQQRVQAGLNEKKRHAMENYMEELQMSVPDSAKILQALKLYVKSEQKDRMHSVNHWKHVADSDPTEAEAIRQQTIDHLAIIDQRIQQSLDMLRRVPKYADKIRASIEDYRRSFQEIDADIADLLQPRIPVEFVESEESQMPVEMEAPAPVKEVISAEEIRKPVVIPQMPEVSMYEEDEGAMEEDEEEEEKTKPFIEIQPAPVAHASMDQFSVNEPGFVKRKVPAPAVGSEFAIAMGCIGIFVLAVIGIVVVRRKANRLPVNHGFIDVTASPEERHVLNMQATGYENPTYKYFEELNTGSA